MVSNLSHEALDLNFIRFESGNLISTLELVNLDTLKFSGYLKVVLDDAQSTSNVKVKTWNLYFSQGKIVFSFCERISITNIIKAISNYLPNLKNNSKIINHELSKIASHRKTNGFSVLQMLEQLAIEVSFVNYEDIKRAVQIHILNELDRYLFRESGTVKVIPNKSIDRQKPTIGFDLKQTILIAKYRKIQWQQLNAVISSMSCNFNCNLQNPEWHSLDPSKKQQIENLVESGNSLAEIRDKLGEDPLIIVKTFAKLLEKSFVVLDPKTNNQGLSITEPSSFINGENSGKSPKIAIIDDSLILLRQFKKIVTDWGYDVRCCSDASAAVEFLLQGIPELIFLDVNMPGISGFQLMKIIRMQPELSSIPLVILTAEKTVMNRQRAKWSKSIFLNKPLHIEEISTFKSELRSLLTKLLPTK